MAKFHKVVQLDSNVHIPEKFDFPHEFVEYPGTAADEVAERIKDATIVMTPSVHLTYDDIMQAPQLELLASMGVAISHFDRQAVTERGITVCNVPAQNTDSVTEHAFALYYAIKRKIVQHHQVAMDGETWARKKVMIRDFEHLPRTNREETLGVVGYGALGKSVQKMAEALGMKVLIAERKGSTDTREGRTGFEDVLRQSTVLILTCPLDDSTRNMIDETELRRMENSALVINVARGGVINERALAAALKTHAIAGAATDVFEIEPATKENSPLLDPTIPNLVLTPHTAWFSSKTIKGTQKLIKENLEAYVAGRPQNVVIAGKTIVGKTINEGS